jgi:heat shock protein 5
MSLVFFTIFALLLLCPVTVNADEDKKSEFGTVIGIGQYTSALPSCVHSN